jgi:hypothetical protein
MPKKNLSLNHQTDLYLSLLNPLFQEYNKQPIQTNLITKLLKEHHLDIAFITHMTRAGLITKLQRGLCCFKHSPSPYWIRKIFECKKEARFLYYKNKKESKKNKSVIPINSIIDVNTNDEIVKAISLLKLNGYKVLKPIQPQYEEI